MVVGEAGRLRVEGEAGGVRSGSQEVLGSEEGVRVRVRIMVQGGGGGSRLEGAGGRGSGLEGCWGGAAALTQGHVVAAVREAGVPVADLGLVAGAGALGLAGHRVGHGCGGGGQGSAGSLAAPPGSPHPAAPPSAGQSGRGQPAAHGGDTAELPSRCHIGASAPRPARALLLHVWLWGSCAAGEGARPVRGWDAAAVSVWAGRGFLAPLGCQQAGAVCLSVCLRGQGARGREAAGSRGRRGCWSVQGSHLCLSRCRASQTASCWPRGGGGTAEWQR